MGVTKSLDVTATQKQIILTLLNKYLPNTTTWAYGSRVKWTARPSSDLDLTIFATPEQAADIALLREAFEESDLPFRVDLFNWNDVPQQFRTNIKADYLVIQDNNIKATENNQFPIKLIDIATHQKGFPFKSKDYQKTGYPVVRVSNFTFDSIDCNALYYVADKIAEKNSNVKLNENDVVIATVGSWPKNPASIVGKTVRIPKEAAGSLLNQNAVRLRVKNNDYHDQLYLYHLLKDKSFVNYIVSTAQGSANQASITLKDIYDFEFLYPPAADRRKSSYCLYSLDKKIQLNRQMNQTLEQMAQALFKSWFVDFDPVMDNALAAGNDIPDELQAKAEQRKAIQQTKNHQALPAEIRQLFPDEFELNEELGWVPKGWKVESVSEAITINPKVKLPKGTAAPFADMKALPTSGYIINEVIEKDYKGGAKFQQHDILLARITPCLENGKTAWVDFLTGEEAGFGSTEFIVLRQKDAIRYPFVACLAREENFKLHCTQSMVGSSGRQRVQNACFDSYFLALPEDNVILERFFDLTAANFNRMTINKNEIRSLTKLRDTLLPKLISGELTLPDVEQLV